MCVCMCVYIYRERDRETAIQKKPHGNRNLKIYNKYTHSKEKGI